MNATSQYTLAVTSCVPAPKYDLIVIDPPWPITKITRNVRPQQTKHLDYQTMNFDWIETLPIASIAEDNAMIFLWTIQKYLPVSFRLLENWGFKYQRTLTWDKGNGMCLFRFHHRTEFVLFGYKGKIAMYPRQKAVPTMFSGKSERHSAKPDNFYTMIEHFGDKRIDVFARKEREGWSVFGNEVPNSITLNM
jgi:N6-adenosine-specific RNA methylase IME4